MTKSPSLTLVYLTPDIEETSYFISLDVIFLIFSAERVTKLKEMVPLPFYHMIRCE